MEEQKDTLGMLDLVTAPGFCVKENRIVKVNAAAAGLLLAPDMELEPLLRTGQEEYRHFSGGCLSLSLEHQQTRWNAFVTRQQDVDVFLLEEDTAHPELQALALAARELRAPLSNAMLIADKLLDNSDPGVNAQVARLNRGLYQLLRIVGNMSDAGYRSSHSTQSLHEMGAVFSGILQKAQSLAQAAGMTLHCTVLSETIYSLCDPEQLERAVLNILSNAIKFSPQGSTIEASLSRSGGMLRLSICDTGSGISDAVLRSVFYRYLRQCTLEDNRFGLGLGMVLIRSAAVQHGGAVLIDQPEGTGTRVTLTLAIRQDAPQLSERILRPIPGGYDSGLVELSEVLPPQMYNGTK